jgi:hypothetical protein
MVVACLLSACAASPDDEYGSCVNCNDGKFDDGHAMDNAGKLVITVPPGARDAKLIAHRQDNPSSVIEFHDGVPQVVASGTYCISTRISSTFVGGLDEPTDEDCTAAVSRDTVTTYALGTVTFVNSLGMLVWGVDNAPTESLVGWGGPLPHAVGVFSYPVGVDPNAPARNLRVTVTPGMNTDVDVADPATVQNGCIVMYPSTSRALPDVPSGEVPGMSMQIVYDGTSNADSAPYTVNDRPLAILAAQSGATSTFEIVASAGAVSHYTVSGKTEIYLGRLDLQPVTVTTDDGSMLTVSGQVDISRTA